MNAARLLVSVGSMLLVAGALSPPTRGSLSPLALGEMVNTRGAVEDSGCFQGANYCSFYSYTEDCSNGCVRCETVSGMEMMCSPSPGFTCNSSAPLNCGDKVQGESYDIVSEEDCMVMGCGCDMFDPSYVLVGGVPESCGYIGQCSQ